MAGGLTFKFLLQTHLPKWLLLQMLLLTMVMRRRRRGKGGLPAPTTLTC